MEEKAFDFGGRRGNETTQKRNKRGVIIILDLIQSDGNPESHLFFLMSYLSVNFPREKNLSEFGLKIVQAFRINV